MTTNLTAILLTLFFFVSPDSKYRAIHDPHNLIEWHQQYKLCWDDFQGDADPASVADAGTAIHIKAQPFYKHKKLEYNVNAYFIKNKSWAREKSERLLEHEQLHFDIAEWYARLARKKINELKAKGINDVKIYNAVVQEILTESNDVDRRYDRETLHGAIQETQQSWNKKVHAEISALDAFR